MTKITGQFPIRPDFFKQDQEPAARAVRLNRFSLLAKAATDYPQRAAALRNGLLLQNVAVGHHSPRLFGLLVGHQFALGHNLQAVLVAHWDMVVRP